MGAEKHLSIPSTVFLMSWVVDKGHSSSVKLISSQTAVRSRKIEKHTGGLDGDVEGEASGKIHEVELSNEKASRFDSYVGFSRRFL